MLYHDCITINIRNEILPSLNYLLFHPPKKSCLLLTSSSIPLNLTLTLSPAIASVLSSSSNMIPKTSTGTCAESHTDLVCNKMLFDNNVISFHISLNLLHLSLLIADGID